MRDIVSHQGIELVRLSVNSTVPVYSSTSAQNGQMMILQRTPLSSYPGIENSHGRLGQDESIGTRLQVSSWAGRKWVELACSVLGEGVCAEICTQKNKDGGDDKIDRVNRLQGHRLSNMDQQRSDATISVRLLLTQAKYVGLIE
jgi:hypothetical protein